MNSTCPQVVDCPGSDDPFLNLSSEGPEPFLYFSVAYGNNPPPLGYNFTATGCVGVCNSTVSQSDADQCAAKQQYLCATGKQKNPTGPPPNNPGNDNPPVFLNQATGCTVQCSDGLPFTWNIPAGVIAAPTQAQADSQAHQDACILAAGHKICLSKLSTTQGTTGTAYAGQITATGAFLAKGDYQFDTWSVVDGAIPDGLTFNGGEFKGGTATITGTPTVVGTFSFIVQIVDPHGDYQRKQYTISISAPAAPNTLHFPFTVVPTDSQCNPSGAAYSGTATVTLSAGGTNDGQFFGKNSTLFFYIICHKPSFGPIQQSLLIAPLHGFGTKQCWWEYDAVAPKSLLDPTGMYVPGSQWLNANPQPGSVQMAPTVASINVTL